MGVGWGVSVGVRKHTKADVMRTGEVGEGREDVVVVVGGGVGGWGGGTRQWRLELLIGNTAGRGSLID